MDDLSTRREERPARVPLVYVVLLNWHGWRDTLPCVESLRRLDYSRHVILIVDNGSTDESVVRIRETAPDVELVETGRNLGFSGGNNVGIELALARGADYVWLLNNDTTVEPGTLSALVRVAEGDARVGAVGSVIRSMGKCDEVQAWGGGRVNLWVGYHRLHETRPAPEDLHYVMGASLFLRREVLLAHGPLDDGFFMFWEDADYCLSIRRKGWRVGVADDSVVLHKQSASFGKDSPTKLRYFSAAAVRFFRKHAPVPAIPIAIGLAGRLAKRVVRRDWAEAGAILRGAGEGWRGVSGGRAA